MSEGKQRVDSEGVGVACDSSFAQLVESQVECRPKESAIIFDGHRLPYGELNRKGNQLAHYLRDLGVGSGHPVGIHLNRSFDMVIAVLAVLKAGAACVPVDSRDPVERKKWILADAEVGVLITESSFDSQVAPKSVREVVLMDDPSSTFCRLSVDNLQISIDPSQLGLLVYTSGSTGRPKGVMLSHGNLLHYVESLSCALGISTSDTVIYRGSVALVVTTRQLLMPLAHGACVAMTNVEQAQNPEAMFDLIDDVKATVVDHAPSFWRACRSRFPIDPGDQKPEIRSGPLRRMTQLRLIGTGGEVISSDLVDWFYQSCPQGTRFVNLYGQTEGDGVVTVAELAPPGPSTVSPACIGNPIEFMRVYLLDSELNEVGVGGRGEICVSGRGVAMGYYRDQELTRSKFVRNPHCQGIKGRDSCYEDLYRTGDQGMLLDDGSILFTGRIDDQVNINGFRVEIGEVEEALNRHSEIAGAAVVARPDTEGILRLAAFIVLENVAGDASIDWFRFSNEIRRFLDGELPRHMVPALFVRLDSLPVGLSGKVRRSALPVPNFGCVRDIGFIEAPVSEVQRRLCAIWEQILFAKPIGILDRFEDLGGDSLRASALIIEVQRSLGVSLLIELDAVRSLTVESMARLIENQTLDFPICKMRTIAEGDHSGPLFILHAVNGLNWFSNLFARFLDERQTVHALYWHPPLSSQGKRESLEQYARRVTDTIIAAEPAGPYRLLGVSFGAQLAFQIAQELISRGIEPEFVGLIDENTDAHMRCFGRRTYLPESSRIDHQCIHMLRCYVPQPYPGPIYTFHSTVKDSESLADSYCGWRELCLDVVTKCEVAGSHFDIVGESNIRQWASALESAMEEASNAWKHHRSNPARIQQLLSMRQSHLLRQDTSSIIAAREAGKEGDRRREIKGYERALESEKDQPYWVNRNLGNAYWDARRYEDAIRTFKLALKREELPIVGYGIVAEKLKCLGEREGVQACLDAIQKENYISAAYQCALGAILMEHGRYEESETAYRWALRAEPRHIYSNLGLAELELRSGRYEEAMSRIEEFLKKYPNDLAFIRIKARILLAKRDSIAVIPVLVQLLRIQPSDLWIRFDLIRALVETGQDVQARKVLEAFAIQLTKSRDGSDFLHRVLMRKLPERTSRILSHGIQGRLLLCAGRVLLRCKPISRFLIVYGKRFLNVSR